MATIDANLFVRYVAGDSPDQAHNRLMFSEGGGTPNIPALNAGDTINFSVYFFDVGSGLFPFLAHRYAGSSVTVRLRAQGNNTIYATGAGTEIVPATGATSSTPQAYGTTQVEKQRWVFNSLPFTGYYKVVFPVMGNGGGISLQNASSDLIPWNVNAAAVLSAIRATRGYYNGNAGRYIYDEILGQLLSSVGNDEGTPPIVVGDPANLSTGLTLQFGSLYGGANYWRNQAQLTIDDSALQYRFGWTVSVPLTDVNFANLFLSGNAPAYLEVLLDGVIAAQYLLTSAGGIGGDPPPPVPGGGGPPANVDGITYDGDHFSAAWAIGPVRSETAFHEAPGYQIFRQRYRIARSSYADLPLDSLCPKDGNAFLVEETERQDVGGADLLEWDRVWAHIPKTIVDGEMVDYVWQTTGSINGAPAIQSIPLTRWATRTRTFHHTSNPATISKARLPRAGVFAGIGLAFDGFVNLYGGATTIARDDDVRRWMGNIWVKTHWEITI